MEELEQVQFLNYKFGKLIELIVDYHMTQSEKIQLAEIFDKCENVESIEAACERFRTINFTSDTDDLKSTTQFKRTLPNHISSQLGYDFLSKLSNEHSNIVVHFNSIEEISKRNDYETREKMAKILEQKHNEVVASVNNVSNIINDFYSSFTEETE